MAKKKGTQHVLKKSSYKNKPAVTKGDTKRVNTTDLQVNLTTNFTTSTGDRLSKLGMRLFGIPYQFPEAVDPRLNELSNTVGKKFTENIILEAPVCTIIPGKPKYLPGDSTEKKRNVSTALLEGAKGDFSSLTQLIEDNSLDQMRLYDFERDYTEYMSFVNILCRVGAAFLDINDTIYVGSTPYTFQQYDWRNYRWNSDAESNMIQRTNTVLTNMRGMKTTGTGANQYKSGWTNVNSPSSNSINFETGEKDEETSITDLLTNYNYVQFYVDPDVGSGDDVSNATSESQMKSMLDSGSAMMKEIAFMANSGGMDLTTFNSFAESSTSALSSFVDETLGSSSSPVGAAGNAISRLINLGGDVLKGSNLIIPDIYQSSSYTSRKSITVHLRTPYGTKLGYYLDIFVPMMHLLALALPKQESSNSYGSPFLIKAYVEGMFTCNLGIVESISIQKVSDSFSIDGLPSEVDVTLNIADLYSDLTMSPQTSPIQFINNTSLIEFLATNCGMSLTKPNYEEKYSMIVDTIKSAFTDIPTTVKSKVQENIYNLISNFTSLY